MRAHGKLWSQNKLLLLGAWAVAWGGGGSQQRLPSSGNKVSLCLLLKCREGRFLPRDLVLANVSEDWKWKQICAGGSDSNTGIWRWFCSEAISCKEINMCDKLPQRAFYRLFSVLFSFQRITAALL